MTNEFPKFRILSVDKLGDMPSDCAYVFVRLEIGEKAMMIVPETGQTYFTSKVKKVTGADGVLTVVTENTTYKFKEDK